MAIGEAVRDVGATLVCLKKAGKFASWLAYGPQLPYILLTDWREVKPCMQAAAQERPKSRPTLTVVLAEMPQQFERASIWAQGLQECFGPVRVCRELGRIDVFLADVVAQLQQSVGLPASSSTQSSDAEEQGNGHPAPAMVHTEKVRRTGSQEASRGWRSAKDLASVSSKSNRSQSLLRATQRIATSLAGAFVDQPCFDACFDIAMQGLTPPLCHGSPGRPHSLLTPLLSTVPVTELWRTDSQTSCTVSSVEDVLSPVFASRNTVEIEQLLKEAMPSHYEE